MNRKDLMVAAGVTAVLGLGWYQFVWGSQAKAADNAVAEAKTANDSANKLRAQVATLTKAKADLEPKADLEAKINQAIPATPDLSTFVKTLQGKAQERGVQITTLSNGQPTAYVDAAAVAGSAPASDAPSQMMVSISLSGDYTAVIRFIDDLDNLSRLMLVDAVTLTPSRGATSDGKLTSVNTVSATVTARVFTTEPPTVPGQAAPTTTAAPAATTATTAAAPSGNGTTASTAAPKGGL